MAGDVDMDEFAAIVAKNDEGKEEAKAEGGDHEEIEVGQSGERKFGAQYSDYKISVRRWL